MSVKGKSMEAFLYQIQNYISITDLNSYRDYLGRYSFTPWRIADEDEFWDMLAFLTGMNERHPCFLSLYEDILLMTEQLPYSSDLEKAVADLRAKWAHESLIIARKENVLEKYVPWEWLSNRPLIRGIVEYAKQEWIAGNYTNAGSVLEEIYLSNTLDPIGVQHAISSIKGQLSYECFKNQNYGRCFLKFNYNVEAQLRCEMLEIKNCRKRSSMQ